MTDFNTRQSNFELLRIFSMFMIIFYHLIFFIVARANPDTPFWHSFQLGLHIGVILFVLVSGYFGIKASTKGLVRLLLMGFIYYVPIVLIDNLVLKDGLTSAEKWKLVIPSFQFISKSPYWFLRTYLWLYLLSPMVNKFINESARNKWVLLIISGIISLYVGYNGADTSVTDGKNIINFFFLYSLGSVLHDTYDTWSKWKAWWIACAFIILNVLLVVTHLHFDGSWYSKTLWQLAYPYNSPILIINAVLAFFLFGKMKFQSNAVNWIASSTFAMYLIHRNPVVLERVLRPVVMKIDAGPWSNFTEIWILLLLSLLIFAVCILIDKLLNVPLSRCRSSIVKLLEKEQG